MLADMQNGGIGVNGAEGGEDAEGFDGKIFKFVGYDVALLSEAVEGGRVVKWGGEAKIGHGGGGAVRIGIKNGEAVA